MTLIEVTNADSEWKHIVIGENICDISPALRSDPKSAKSVLVMSNGFRICVKEDMEDIRKKLIGE